MPTRYLTFHKFYYTKDNGDIQVQVQEIYYRTEDGQPVTPITPLLMAVTINAPDVIPVTGKNMRHLLACSLNPHVERGYSEAKAYIPYPPGDENLKNHIREILSVDWVRSGTYIGEPSKIKPL